MAHEDNKKRKFAIPQRVRTGFNHLRKNWLLAAISILFFFSGPANIVFAAPGGIVEAVAFYSIAATIVTAFLLINVALKNTPGVYYALLFAIMLAVVWMLEGGLVMAAPNMESSLRRSLDISVGLFAAGFGYTTALSAIDPDSKATRLRKVLKVAAIASLGLIPFAWMLPATAAAAANVALVGMFAAHVASTATWRTFTDRPNRSALIVAGAIALAILIAGVIAIYAVQSGASAAAVLSEMRIFRMIYAVAALSTMAVIVIGLIDMRRSRDAALEAALSAARKDAETSAELLQMERDYAKAREIAAKGARTLSTASHDIKQPLASLRAELDALKGNALTVSVIDRLSVIVDHMAGLTEDMSRTARAEASTEKQLPQRDGDIESNLSNGQTENFPATLILDTLVRMFDREARIHGAALKVVESSTVFAASPTAVLRIGANLVTNAIQHAEASKILIGVKRSGDMAALIVADNGKGFEEGFGHSGDAFASGVKGAASKGEGLGLSIVKEIADENGYALQLRTLGNRGSIFTVRIPVETTA